MWALPLAAAGSAGGRLEPQKNDSFPLIQRAILGIGVVRSYPLVQDDLRTTWVLTIDGRLVGPGCGIRLTKDGNIRNYGNYLARDATLHAHGEVNVTTDGLRTWHLNLLL